MTEVTTDMIKDYILRKGGVVRNVDLVRHFRKFLQQTDPVLKDHAREIFKERVNQIAFIKAEQGEKFLYLKQEFIPAGNLHRPPSGRHPNLSNYDRYSSASIDSTSSLSQRQGPPPPLLPRDSLQQLLTEQTIGSVPANYKPLSQATGTGLSRNHSQIPNSTQAGIVHHSYKPVSSPPPRVTAISPTPPPSSVTTSSLFSPPPSSTPSPSPFSPPPSSAPHQSEDSGESLLAQMTAELSNFGSGLGSLFGSFGSTTTSQPPPSFSPTPPPAPVQPAKPIRTTPSLTGPSVVQPVDMASTSTTSPRRNPPSPPSGPQRPTPVVPSSPQRLSPSVSQRAPPSPPSGPQRAPPLPPSGPQRTPPLPPSGPQRTPPLPPSGPQHASHLPPSGPQRTPPLPPSGPHHASHLPPSGPQRTPPLPPSGPQRTPPLPPSGLQRTSLSDPQHAPPSPPSGYNRRPAVEKRLISQLWRKVFSPRLQDKVWEGGLAPPPPTSQPPPPQPTFSAPSSGRRLGPPVELPSLNGTHSPPGEPGGPAPFSSTRGSLDSPRRQGSAEKARDGHRKQGSMERSIMEMGFWGQGSMDSAMDSHRRQGSSERTMDGHRRQGSGEKTADGHRRQGSMERAILELGHQRRGSMERAVMELRHQRQGSVERATETQSPGVPGIKVESPTRSMSVDSGGSPPNGFSSPIGGAPSSLGPSDVRGRAHTIGTGLANGGASLGVVLRRDRNPQDGGKVVVGRTHSSAGARRSRNLETKTLESITRGSIAMTPPASRRNKPPTVAPKPWREQTASGSGEDLALEGDDEGSVTAISESAEGDYYYDIDPLEKEWMVATAQSDLDSIHRLIMTDPSLVNRRDFIHYTALHWAAKHGRCDIISGLMINGAYVDLKSGFTPLHMAAQVGHDNAIQLLVREYGASVNSREHSGRKPIDILSVKSSEETRTLLCMSLDGFSTHSRFVPLSNHLSTFSQPHGKTASIHRQWSSVGELYNKRIDPDKPKKRISPRMSIRKSFSFRSSKDKKGSPGKKDSKENKRQRIDSYNWDV